MVIECPASVKGTQMMWCFAAMLVDVSGKVRLELLVKKGRVESSCMLVLEGRHTLIRGYCCAQTPRRPIHGLKWTAERVAPISTLVLINLPQEHSGLRAPGHSLFWCSAASPFCVTAVLFARHTGVSLSAFLRQGVIVDMPCSYSILDRIVRSG